jgi:lipopolysaccharide/colanic/teichoic acid biosynthesis glycosyltransferase
MTLHFSPAESGLKRKQPSSAADVARNNKFYRTKGKRAFDIFLVVALAPIVLPFIAVFALLIMMDGHNPFYSQIRVGKDGKNFRMWKLRTMLHNADEMLDAYLAEDPLAKLEWDSTQKLKKDPRITLVGRILRKTSLDELPQLWNVVSGTMSVVGPRPMMVKQKGSYSGEGYYRLKPGITGLWQVSDRNEGEFVGRVRYDDIYDRTVSLGLDLWVIMRTVVVVFRCTGY